MQCRKWVVNRSAMDRQNTVNQNVIVGGRNEYCQELKTNTKKDTVITELNPKYNDGSFKRGFHGASGKE